MKKQIGLKRPTWITNKFNCICVRTASYYSKRSKKKTKVKVLLLYIIQLLALYTLPSISSEGQTFDLYL